MMGGFLRQYFAVGLGTHVNDAPVRFMPMFFQLCGGCPSSSGLSSVCLLLHLDPT
jgi:hypothetical protein